MLRIILGVIGGFVGWLVAWVGAEKILSVIWPAFGIHQAAFQAAVEKGGPFTADTRALLTHIVLGAIVSVIAGSLAALIAGESKRAPLILGFLLLTMGLMKLVMSWSLVPGWYHFAFTAMLVPMAIVGGKLTKRTQN